VSGEWGSKLPDQLDFVFCLTSSDRRTEEAYVRSYLLAQQNLVRILSRRNHYPERFFFASSTSVYSQQSGEWVDEDSPTLPRHFTGLRMLEAEQRLRACSLPTTVIRFGGIYGPERFRLLRRVAHSEEKLYAGPPVYTNRIHVEDCASVLSHLMTVRNPEAVYIAVDNEPVDRNVLVKWLSKRLEVSEPETIPLDRASERLRRNNKRCNNALLRSTEFRFRFPTFREGYSELIRMMI
jgi:nucleoside-diphosphate-sugar epimerase